MYNQAVNYKVCATERCYELPALCSIGGMILTRENQKPWKKSCPNATLSTTDPTKIALGFNMGLSDER
jgi:hypothetical protein